MRSSSLLIVFSIALLGLSLASAQTASDKKSEAIALVEKAAVLCAEHGKKKDLPK